MIQKNYIDIELQSIKLLTIAKKQNNEIDYGGTSFICAVSQLRLQDKLVQKYFKVHSFYHRLSKIYYMFVFIKVLHVICYICYVFFIFKYSLYLKKFNKRVHIQKNC